MKQRKYILSLALVALSLALPSASSGPLVWQIRRIRGIGSLRLWLRRREFSLRDGAYSDAAVLRPASTGVLLASCGSYVWVQPIRLSRRCADPEIVEPQDLSQVIQNPYVQPASQDATEVDDAATAKKR